MAQKPKKKERCPICNKIYNPSETVDLFRALVFSDGYNEATVESDGTVYKFDWGQVKLAGGCPSCDLAPLQDAYRFLRDQCVRAPYLPARLWCPACKGALTLMESEEVIETPAVLSGLEVLVCTSSGCRLEGLSLNLPVIDLYPGEFTGTLPGGAVQEE